MSLMNSPTSICPLHRLFINHLLCFLFDKHNNLMIDLFAMTVGTNSFSTHHSISFASLPTLLWQRNETNWMKIMIDLFFFANFVVVVVEFDDKILLPWIASRNDGYLKQKINVVSIVKQKTNMKQNTLLLSLIHLL